MDTTFATARCEDAEVIRPAENRPENAADTMEESAISAESDTGIVVVGMHT